MADINVKLPDGSNANFPDGTAQDVMERAIQQHLNWKPPATQAAANTEAAPPSKGDVRPTNKDVFEAVGKYQEAMAPFMQWDQNVRQLQANHPAISLTPAEQTAGKISGISAQPTPSGVHALAAPIENMLIPFIQHIQRGGGAPTENLADLSAITPYKNSPIGQSVGEFASGLTTPTNILLGVGMAGAPAVLSKLAGLGFSEEMIRGAFSQYKPFRDAIQAGDADGALYHFSNAVLSGALGLHSATEGMSTDPKTREAVREQLKQTNRGKGTDPSLNTKIREAATLPDRATPRGPISETGGSQLQLDFTTKAPIEATAPKITAENASKAAAAPILDRQALIAPEPQGFNTEKAIQEGYAKEFDKPLDRRQNLELRQAIDKIKDSPNEALQHFQAAAELARAKDPSGVDPIPVTPVTEPVKTMNPAELHGVFDKIADLARQSDLAENDDHARDLLQQHHETEAQTRDLVRSHLTGQPTAQVSEFRDQSMVEAQKVEAQSTAIRDLTEATIRNRGVKNELTDLRSQGGPPRTAVVDPETGERAVVKPQDKVGRGGRSILDELQGRVPNSDFSTLKVAGKPEGVSDQEWGEYVGKMQTERTDLKRKISDAVEIASDTGASVADMGIEEHVDRLKQLEGILGKYEEPSSVGRRPNIPAELDENGAVKAPEPLKSWTLARAELALGKKLRMIPSDEEFFQHADARAEKGRLFRTVADDAQKVLDKRKSQGGFVGELPSGNPADYHKLVPSDDDMIDRARAAGYRAWKPTVDEPSGVSGWLSKDGKSYIDKSHTTPQYDKEGRRLNVTHLDIAASVLPDVPWLPKVTPERVMLDKGWIKKAGPTEYEAWNLDSTTKRSIENDLLYKGKFGNVETYITTRGTNGRLQSLTLERGYEDFDKALTKARSKSIDNPEFGAVKGTSLLTGGTAGGVAGAVVGAHLGHPVEGFAIGWATGFMTPAIADRVQFMNKIRAVGPGLSSLGIKMSDWLRGPEQEKSVLRDMDNIRDAQQRDVRGPVRSFVNRVSQIPGNILVGHNKFAFLNDQAGTVFPSVMKLLGDERGRQFFDLRGKIDVDNSPYVSAWLAAGGGGGMAEAHLIDYKGVIGDAQKSGMGEHLSDYLNLKGYQRVFDVAKERINEYDDAILKAKQTLQVPKLPVEVEAGVRKAMRQAQSERQDVIDKMATGTMVPQPYGPGKIASDLQDLQTKLGPKFNDVKALADRVFALNRKVLDLVHGAGIIADGDYQKYIGRGDEYIPMHRILEQAADVNGRNYGTSNPLYLRQQNVIKALMGSDKINRDPIVASADANLEALREVARNGVMKDFLKLAQADPQGVGSLIREVPNGHKAGVDKGLIGFYDQGSSHTFEAPTWLTESLKNVSPMDQDIIGKGPMQYFGKILRQGATVGNLAWSVPNALRHLGDMAIMSDEGLVDRFIKNPGGLPRDVVGLIKEWNKSLYSTIVSDPARQEFLRSGSAYSTLQSVITPEEHLSLDTLGFKQKVAKGRFIEVAADLNKAVEDATKMTTYKRLREAGYSEKNAAWETRNYGGGPDFAKQGNMSQAIGLASMFYNAHLQYISRIFARAVDNPQRVGVALGSLTAMAMMLNQWNQSQKDEKGNSQMRKVPFSERENNFVVLTGETYQDTGMPHKLLIPKPSFAKILYNPIENTINKMAGYDDREGVTMGLQALSNMLPGQTTMPEGQGYGVKDVGKSLARGAVSSLNPLFKTPLEESMNYETTGTGRPIVPTREQGIDSQYQFGPGTSETAKQIGQGGLRGAAAGAAEGAGVGYLLGGPKGAALGGALGSVTGAIGVSPRRAEHVIDSTTAGAGRMATGFVDPFLGGVHQTLMGADKYTNFPVAGPMAQRFMGSSVDQQEQTLTEQFYRDTQAAQQPLATLQFLQKNHPEQIPQYLQDHKDDLWKGKLATDMQQRLGKVQNAEKEVLNAQMPDADKASALKNLHDVKIQVLKAFTGVLRPSPQVPQASAYPGQGQGAPH